MRYILATAGLLVGASAIFGVWMLVPRGDAPRAAGQANAAETGRAPSSATLSAEGQDGSLRVCNETGNRVSIAFGYRAEKGWQSEGWWVAEPTKCATLYHGDLKARRYYYLFAADDIGGGVWDGANFMCTSDESFTIFGIEDCLARGYERTGFFEIDTQNKSSWTLQLIDGDVVNGGEDDNSEDAVPLEGDLPTDGRAAPDDSNDAPREGDGTSTD